MLSATACLQLDLGDPADSGAAATPSSTSDAGSPAAINGTVCATDSVSKITLCTSIDPCAGLAVDHDAYPDCGFRVPSLTIDLECVCGDSVCPMGTTLTCAQAQALLADGSEIAVCTQELEGRCAPRGSTGTNVSPTCDRNCAAECGADLNCLGLCGC
jgi:hypothetical protein